MSARRRAASRREVLSWLGGGALAAAAVAIAEVPTPRGDVVATGRSTEPVDLSALTQFTPSARRLRVPEPRRFFYSQGSTPLGQKFGDMYIPVTNSSSLPVVVLIHGGGWSAGQTLDYIVPLARDLASSGVAVWNVEYRVAGEGGAWPRTVADVCDAVDALPTVRRELDSRIDLSRIVSVGHSAGGHLALWLAMRSTLTKDLPGNTPSTAVAGAVSLAGVTDLSHAYTYGGDRFVSNLLKGTPEEKPGLYRKASPISHLPSKVPTVLVHGSADQVVDVAQSRRFVSAAKATGSPSTLIELPGIDHDDMIFPENQSWRISRSAIFDMLQSL